MLDRPRSALSVGRVITAVPAVRMSGRGLAWRPSASTWADEGRGDAVRIAPAAAKGRALTVTVRRVQDRPTAKGKGPSARRLRAFVFSGQHRDRTCDPPRVKGMLYR